jgi:STE24 endopeptidase
MSVPAGTLPREQQRQEGPKMTTTGTRRPRIVRQRAVRFRLWPAVAAAPAALGSLLLMVLAAGALGRWAGLLPLAWAGCAAMPMTRIGERVTVRCACRFHRPTPGQAAALQPAWAAALRLTGTDAGEVEPYVQAAQVPNAYAAGRRSVAVTTRVLEDHQSRRLPETELVAVLVHELGHHVTGATRSMLLMWWLAGPWRMTASVLTRLALRLSGRLPGRGLVVVVGVGLVVAVTRALHQGQWTVGGVLLFVAVSAVLCPLASAAVSRQAEFAADRFAADHGLAHELAAAIHATGDVRGSVPGWPVQLLATHPTAEQRIRALLGTRVASRM